MRWVFYCRACSASNPLVGANTDSVKVITPPVGVVKSAYEYQANNVKEQVELIPKWYTNMLSKKDAIYDSRNCEYTRLATFK